VAKPNKENEKISKIVKYNLEEECISLKQQGFSLTQIAEELNKNSNIPQSDKIDRYTVNRFINKIPNVDQVLLNIDKVNYLQNFNSSMDILQEATDFYNKTRTLLETMEKEAEKVKRYVNPYQFKAVVSEAREFLKQITDLQKEINDYKNVHKFMEIVLKVLQEECPEKIPIIAERLKVGKDTQWFSDIINKKL
jgi:superfamily II DNA helicase RecQ